ncbi:hypothetical protein J6590_055965 [Homalodisca vitripennis]|nr:hypothetical protein J6590_055965 [Homalodisca vitripennis]
MVVGTANQIVGEGRQPGLMAPVARQLKTIPSSLRGPELSADYCIFRHFTQITEHSLHLAASLYPKNGSLKPNISCRPMLRRVAPKIADISWFGSTNCSGMQDKGVKFGLAAWLRGGFIAAKLAAGGRGNYLPMIT